MANKTISVSMDEEVIRKIDEAAKASYMTRSAFIALVAGESANLITQDAVQGVAKAFAHTAGKELVISE